MKISFTALCQLIIGFMMNLNLASSAFAEVKIEMPDLLLAQHTVCKVEGVNKDDTNDQVDSSNPADYKTFGKSAYKNFKNDKLEVSVEISEGYYGAKISFNVESLVNNKEIASNITSMRRGGYYTNVVAKPDGHFEPGEKEFIRVICGKKQIW